MPDDGNKSASPNLTPPLQPASRWLNPGLNPPKLGLYCETPNGFIELPWLRLKPPLDRQVRDYCHKATLDYLAKHKLDYLNLPFHPHILRRSIINHDGFTFTTPAFLHLRKLDAAAIFSVKPAALPIGNSSLTGAGLWFEYHVSPRFQIGTAGSYGKTSTDLYDRPINPRQDLGVTLFIKGKF